jgi:alpha-amylase/alpha-mannosidase (GH57 family)
MTPFAHPILPLLVDTNLASMACLSSAPPRFNFGQDAQAQVISACSSTDLRHPPRGVWPAEGSVSRYRHVVNPASSGWPG